MGTEVAEEEIEVSLENEEDKGEETGEEESVEEGIEAQPTNARADNPYNSPKRFFIVAASMSCPYLTATRHFMRNNPAFGGLEGVELTLIWGKKAYPVH